MIDEKVGPKGLKLFSMRKAVAELGASRSSIKRLISAGELRSFQYTDDGWHWIHARSIDEYLARRAKKSAPKSSRRTRA